MAHEPVRKAEAGIFIFEQIDHLEYSQVIERNPQNDSQDPIQRVGKVFNNREKEKIRRNGQEQEISSEHARIVAAFTLEIKKKCMRYKVACRNQHGGNAQP